VALILGSVLRLGGGFLLGSQDVEWWKVWAKDFHENGLLQCYGPPDYEILDRLSKGQTLKQIYTETGRVVKAESYPIKTWRTEFPVVQPPIFHYLLRASAWGYSFFSPSLENTRLFNFFINLVPLMAAGAMTALLFWALRRFGQDENEAALAAASFWLFPLMLLNSPIQGYFDMVVAMGVFATTLALARGHLALACVLCVVTFLSKPQGVLIVPVVLVIGVFHFSALRNIKAWLAASLAGFLIAAPYFVSGYGLSFINAVLHPTQHGGALTVQSLNFWWLPNYRIAMGKLVARGMSSWEAFRGANRIAFRIYTQADLEQALHFKLSVLPSLVFPVFAIFILYYASALYKVERKSLFLSMTIFLYAFVTFGLGVHTNHYFIFLPVLLVSACLYPEFRRWACGVAAVFLVQDLFFYGLGRDFTSPTQYAIEYGLSFLSLIPALCSVGLFAWGLRQFYRLWRRETRVAFEPR